MKNFLLSAAVLLCAAFAATADDRKAEPTRTGEAKPAMKSIDGAWTIVCYEKDGQPMPEAKNMTVMAKGDTITCSGKDGKPAMSMKVTFGDKGMVKVTEMSGADDKGTMKAGVYTMTNDFLSMCVHEEGSTGDKSKCTVFLKRADAARTGAETKPDVK